MSYIVTASRLNVRRGPSMNDPVTGSLANGATVNVVEQTNADWWKVTTPDNAVGGYVASRYLREIPVPKPPAQQNPYQVKAVHYAANPSSNRKSTVARHCPLSESGQPKRNGGAGSTPASRISETYAIVNYLDVVSSARYQPTSSSTYCNIYAYDFCYLSGAYLPRVWWLSKTLMEFAKTPGYDPAPQYAKNVGELNANALYDWLDEWGDDFGWVRATSMDEIQAKVNEGRVGVICAKRRNPSRSGHITCVLPETGGYSAQRNGTTVTAPLQSQAGRVNKKYFSSVWWSNSNEYSDFGFWYHD